MSNFLEINAWESSCSRLDRQSDGQTDMTKLTVAVWNVVNTSKNRGNAQLLVSHYYLSGNK